MIKIPTKIISGVVAAVGLLLVPVLSFAQLATINVTDLDNCINGSGVCLGSLAGYNIVQYAQSSVSGYYYPVFQPTAGDVGVTTYLDSWAIDFSDPAHPSCYASSNCRDAYWFASPDLPSDILAAVSWTMGGSDSFVSIPAVSGFGIPSPDRFGAAIDLTNPRTDAVYVGVGIIVLALLVIGFCHVATLSRHAGKAA